MLRVELRATFVLTGLLWLAGCSEGVDDSDGMGGAGSAETTVDDWRDYCVATMTEDYEVLDSRGEPLFTAKTGDEYLVSGLGLHSAGLVYIAPNGPYSFRIETNDGLWPATFSCLYGLTTPYWAVFVSATVFAEPELTTPVCELEAGTHSPLGSAPTSGMTSGGMSGAYFFELRGNALGPTCEGIDVGYVETASTRVLGDATLLAPVGVIVGPS